MLRKQARPLLLGVSLMLPLAATADIVVLRDGQTREGRVEEVVGKPDRIALITATGRIELRRDRIKEIVDEPDSVDWRRIGDQLAASRNYPQALENYRKALAADPNNREAQEGLQKVTAALEERRLDEERKQASTLDTRIDEAKKLTADGKYADAEKALEAVSKGNPSEVQRTAAQVALMELYLAWGFERLDKLDYRGAEERYLRVLEMDPENKQARDMLLRVWRNDSTKREEVLKAYEAKLREDPDNLEYNQQVADLSIALNRFENAIAPLEKLVASPKYRALQYDKFYRSALTEVIRYQRDAGNWDAAIVNTEKLLTAFPGEDSSQLAVLRYRKAVAATDPGDINARALLIKKLRDDGMVDLAQSEAALLATRAPQNEIVRAILREEAEQRLAEVAEMMTSQDYAVARDRSRAFIDRYPQYPDLVQKATEYYEKSRVEYERQAKAKREMAREIGQRGIEYKNQAYTYAEQMRSTETNNRSRPYSPKQEAIKFARRAISTLETAISIDPSLGPMTGMDLNAHLADAKQLLGTLTGSVSPTYRDRPVSNNPQNNRGQTIKN